MATDARGHLDKRHFHVSQHGDVPHVAAVGMCRLCTQAARAGRAQLELRGCMAAGPAAWQATVLGPKPVTPRHSPAHGASCHMLACFLTWASIQSCICLDQRSNAGRALPLHLPMSMLVTMQSCSW